MEWTTGATQTTKLKREVITKARGRFNNRGDQRTNRGEGLGILRGGVRCREARETGECLAVERDRGERRVGAKEGPWNRAGKTVEPWKLPWEQVSGWGQESGLELEDMRAQGGGCGRTQGKTNK